MKVAICFAGQPRNVESTYHKSIYQNLIQPNQHHQLDVFVHNWYAKDQENQPYINAGGHLASLPVPPDVFNVIYRLYNPVEMKIAKPVQFGYPDRWNDRCYPDIIIPYSLSRMYSTQQVVDMCTSTDDYDLIAIGRFDTLLHSPLVLDNLNQPGKIFDLGLAPHGINILWMVGTPSIIQTYSNIIDHLDTIIELGTPFCDEYLIKHYLRMNNIELEPLNVHCTINKEHL